MVKRDNHYEVAFEAFLRFHSIPYVGMDEQRRSIVGDKSLKSPDFIVSPTGQGFSWLVEVKGRRFPTGTAKQYWKNWSTADELISLAHWESLMGPRSAALLVFAYNIVGDQAPLPVDQLFEFQNALYGFVAIRLDHYTSWAKPLSVRWNTVTVSTPKFRTLAKGVQSFFQMPEPKRLVDRENETF